MHSNETLPAPATGPALLLQLGRLIVRSRSASPAPSAHDRLLQAKLLQANPSTSQQVHTQPKFEVEEQKPAVEAQLSSHVHALWNDQIPVCIEVLLAPDCKDCYASITRTDSEATFDKQHSSQRALLLERWTMQALPSKAHEEPSFSSAAWLTNAIRSQLHFSQLSAWRARLASRQDHHARRKLSRESCNYKKLEANCDQDELTDEKRNLNVVYSIRIPGESYKAAEFVRQPTDHKFPITDIGNNVHLKVVLESLPRIDEIPIVKCTCQKRRASKETLHEELTGKLNDLTIGPKKYQEQAINSNIGTSTRRLSIISNPGATEYLFTTEDKGKMLDDRMHTPCSENGKHKCNCDDESDGRDNSKSPKSQEPKKLDERRLKEIAKYKRRLRKESKLKKLCDSTSSEGDIQQKTKETHTSIPILQAARFDRLRAIGCYRNQTYLTLPASRMESKSPFAEAVSIPPAEFKRTNTIATQTDDLSCTCGNVIQMKCDDCNQNRMVRSEANYNLASLEKSNGARRKSEDEGKVLKKHKCDNFSSNPQCDNINRSSVSEVIQRPKLRRFLAQRLDKIVSDRFSQRDMEVLNLDKEDSCFSVPKQESKRQKTFSISDDYVLFEKCDYGTFDKFDNDGMDSPKEIDQNGFSYPEPKRGVDNQIPSPGEMDRFRWTFDSAASMVFHTKTGLPLTSSPAPLRRGNNSFDFDDSINGISGIKSALFHPITSDPPAPPARPPRARFAPSAGLLGSFEESALKGRLEPVATVAGFSAELGASGAFCPPHRRLPVTVFFYAPGGTNAPYMGHINLGSSGYRVARSGTVQVSLFNPHGTLVKMFVVLYDLTGMPPMAKTFLRQRTLYMPAGADPPKSHLHKWLRYLIHLRFMTSKSGKLYLHTDIRIIVSRKADLDTATAHSLFRPIANSAGDDKAENGGRPPPDAGTPPPGAGTADKCRPNRVFGGSSEFDSELKSDFRELGYENRNGVSYELRSFTYAPENPRYSPR